MGKGEPYRLIFSKRFAKGEDCSDFSTSVIEALYSHAYFKDFKCYNPDAFNKTFCGRSGEETSLMWPCRGTQETCAAPACTKDGHPTSKSCWRFSYCWHEKAATDVNGFLVQIVEFDMGEWRKHGKLVLKIGDGQKIEEAMARDMNLKVFKIKQLRIEENDKGVNPASLDELAAEVEAWLQS